MTCDHGEREHGLQNVNSADTEGRPGKRPYVIEDMHYAQTEASISDEISYVTK